MFLSDEGSMLETLEDAIRHPPKVVLVENVFWIPNHNPKPNPNFGYQ